MRTTTWRDAPHPSVYDNNGILSVCVCVGGPFLSPSVCVRFFLCFFCAGICHRRMPPAAAAVVAENTHTHTHTHARTKNESCWELELHSIRVTTYLQTVEGGGCLSVTHQPSGTLALLTRRPPLANRATKERGSGRAREGGRDGER